mmetsp:Transcript_7724/g.28016  ORF Transcript_7724/g.28016 Transcript_7724/m.28016 type:complete len:221 (+) Transcript_7724:6669-7331(+)
MSIPGQDLEVCWAPSAEGSGVPDPGALGDSARHRDGPRGHRRAHVSVQHYLDAQDGYLEVKISDLGGNVHGLKCLLLGVVLHQLGEGQPGWRARKGHLQRLRISEGRGRELPLPGHVAGPVPVLIPELHHDLAQFVHDSAMDPEAGHHGRSRIRNARKDLESEGQRHWGGLALALKPVVELARVNSRLGGNVRGLMVEEWDAASRAPLLLQRGRELQKGV